MSLEMISVLIDDEDERQLLINIKHKLEPAPSCSIYRVPRSLRKLNEKAYTPQIISIGPLHYGKEELVDMEKQKKRYMESFLNRITIEQWEQMLAFTKDNEQHIRKCYEETSNMGSTEFVGMILYDAIFIMELFWRYYNRDVYFESDFLLNRMALYSSLSMDLQLIENQLPYFVLEKLYNLAFVNPHHPTFMDLSSIYFSKVMFSSVLYDGHMPEETVVIHFTDLIRTALLNNFQKVEDAKCIADLPCAVKLQESGIKFKAIKRECLLDIRFKKRKRRHIPFFQVHELQIPVLMVNEHTETFFRNVMALEQCHYSRDTRICSYVLLMDSFIGTDKDVDLLVGKGIIINCYGNSALVTNMFNKLGLQIGMRGNCYHELGEELKAHFNNPLNHAKATLRRVYFSNPWKGTATVAAITLLLLTVIQTICSIRQADWIV